MRFTSSLIIATCGLVIGAAGVRAGDADPAGRTLVNEAVIDAPVETVWDLFTTPEGMRSWMAPVADIDLRVGGAMRTSYVPGVELGGPETIINTIISFEPGRMLSIRNTKAPDGFAHAELFAQTWSVIHFEPVGESRTRVRTVGLGYGQGPQWDELYDYFQRGNDFVLARLQEAAGGRRAPGEDLAAPPSPALQTYLASIAAAHASLRLNETKAARRWLEAAPVEHRGWEWSYLRRAADQSRRTLEPHDDVIYAVAHSPDGARLAAASGDHSASLIDAATGTVLATLRGHEAAVYNVAFSPDGALLATCSRDKTIRLWDTSTFETVRVITDPDSHILSVAFSPDGTRLAGSLLSVAKIWNAGTGELEATLEGHVRRPPVVTVAWSHDGRHVATGSWDNWAIIWDATTGRPVHKLGPGYGNEDYAQMKTIAFSPDDAQLVAATSDGSWFTWDVESGELLARIAAHEKDCLGIAISPDGRHVATAGQDGLVKLWDASSRALLATLRGHTSGVRTVAFSPDGTALVSAGDDHSIRWWVADAAAHADSWQAHDGGPWGIAYTPDGRRIVTGGSESEARVWDAASRTLIRSLPGHTDQVAAAACAPDGRRAVTGSNDGSVRVWDLDTGASLFASEDVGRAVQDVEWSPDGAAFAACAVVNSVRVWDAQTFEPRLVLEGNRYRRVAFSPDGARLATTESDGWVRVWDLATGEAVASFQPASGAPLYECAFSPDGRLLAVTAEDMTVRLWEVETPRQVHSLTGLDASAYDVTFLPDGSRVVASAYDSTVRLWDVASGQLTLTIPSPEWVWTLTVSPDGETIAWGPVNGRVVLSRGRAATSSTP